MARTYTVAQLIERIRLLGDYTNADGGYSEEASHMSSGTLLQFVDVANAFVHDLYSDVDEEYNLKRVTYSITSGDGEYDLPADFHKLRSLEVAAEGSSTGWVPLDRANVMDDAYGSSATDPGAYRLLSGSFELLPSPGSATSVRVSYVPCATQLTSTSDTIDGVNGYDQVVVLKALEMCRIREERPYDDIRLQLNEHMTQMKESIRRRDRARPRRMIPRGRRVTRW